MKRKSKLDIMSSKRKKLRASTANNLKRKAIYDPNQKLLYSNARPSTSNQFECLSDMEEDDVNTNNDYSEVLTKIPKVPKVPPIIITHSQFDGAILKSLNLPDINLKFISLGIKVSFKESSSFEKCIEYLKINNIEFYTHRVKDNIFKVILSGLPKTNTDDIKMELNSKYNLNVLNVRELETSYYNKHSRLYLLNLDKGDITLKELNQIKVINHTIVKWLRFSPKHKGPTQCHNCLLFGHGAENCHRGVTCMLCASSQHATANCSLNNDPDNKVIRYKCANCLSKNRPSNHRANDPNCPSKAEYQNIRNDLRIRNSKNSYRSNQFQSTQNIHINRSKQQNQNQSMRSNSNQNHLNVNAEEFSFNTCHFPSLSGNQHHDANSSFRFNKSYSNVTKNDLFSPEEFFNIFDDALVKFYECKSKIDQIALIASLLRRAIR